MDRRTFLGALAAAALAPKASATAMRRVPSTRESIPAIGMGTWITFDVGTDPAARAQRVDVLRTFFELGGRLVDSSPMYGSAPDVIGHALGQLDGGALLSASKVWIPGRDRGIDQMNHQLGRWGIERFDLVQVHNMVDWRTHLATLVAMKAAGQLKYTGITTSHGRRHDALAEVIRTQPFDFVQFTYSLANRQAERRLLPLALDQGKAVIINRPFEGGGLFRRVGDRPLPPIAADLGCATWAAFFLKFVISHPAVTCAIPATSRVDHMRENMAALTGPMPDAPARKEMIRAFEATR
ncbi:MAG: aldo/keto reductase [Pseudomonadota bacterium]